MEDYCAAHTMTRRVALLNLGLLAIFGTRRTQADEPKSAKTHFHIEATDAAAALNEFSEQAGLMLLFDFETLMRVKSRAINGSYTPVEALQKMLEGTGVVYTWLNDRTLSVQVKEGNR
jgi:iron complex outermembrane receptor protein